MNEQSKWYRARPQHSPDTTDDERTGNGVIIGVVVGVIILLAGVLGVSLLTSTESTVDDAVGGEGLEKSVVTSIPVPPIPPIEIPEPEEIDPELAAWNEENGPKIGRLYAILLSPPVRNITLLRFRCKQMGEAVEDLINVPKPPNQEVAEAFDMWVIAVRDAVTFCLEGSLDLPDNEALPIAGSTIGSTSLFWENFNREMAKRVDLTGAPPGVSPELP